MATSFDLDAAVEALVALGLDSRAVRADLESIPDDEPPEEDVAAMVVESGAGVHFDIQQPLEDSVVELVDAFRRAGVPCRLDTADGAPVVVVDQDRISRAHRIQIDDKLTHELLVAAVIRLLPAGYSLRLCPTSTHEESYAIAVLSAQEVALLEAAISREALGRVLPQPSAARVHSYVAAIAMDAIDPPDWDARLAAHGMAIRVAAPWEDIWDRLCQLDPRLVWPKESARPAGDDYFELTQALCAQPLATCIESGDRVAWANLLYRWALATYVGARWDRLACRYNPGTSAQGMLGLGQLTWAWFILDAMGAEEAEDVGELLGLPWIRAQERSVLSVRQCAWFDLGAWMRSGDRGAELGRVYELSLLAEASAWDDAGLVEAALKVHCELRGDQFTHHPLYWCWPAPMYALARRAGVLDSLPADNPLLRHAVSMDDVVLDAEVVRGLRSVNAQFDVIEAERLPPLLDPLPVIVDVKIVSLDDVEVVGRTVLGGDEDGEHDVRAPHPGKPMEVGQIWSLMVEDSISEVSAPENPGSDRLAGRPRRIAIPTGVWLERLQ